MTSIGEVMSIGRTFEEAIQKALRMVSGGACEGFEADSKVVDSWDITNTVMVTKLNDLLLHPSISRMTAIATAFEVG